MSDEDPKGVDQQKVLGADTNGKSAEELEKDAAVNDFSKLKEVNGRESMEVKVYSPFHNYYEGPAFSVSAENATGPFDILPRHHNFISLLNPCDLIVRSAEKGDQKFRIGGGIMHVKADQVIVFLDV